MMNRTKQFRRGLVVGKFCPLHKGHELLINHALAACEQVTIISYTKPEFEYCDRAAREAWLTSLFPAAEILVIDDGSLRDICRKRDLPFREIPHNDAGDDIHRQFVGWLCCEVLSHTVDAVFTSEDYGDDFAKVLSGYFSRHAGLPARVTHVCVDKSRLVIPISGTAIRENPHRHRHFLSPIVYANFVKRVCLLGGESSGKTTLAQTVAKRLCTKWVSEYGRELWGRKHGRLEYEDMLQIARTQVAFEIDGLARANKWLICDTSPLTTLCYSLTMFGEAERELRELANRSYDVVLLCAPDFLFVQDGTRQNSEFRARQHLWYLKEFHEREIHYEVVSGPLSARVDQVVRLLA
ncbi:MAG: HTH-type transcriptional regulator, transcriptional repressor of biosynthesis s [Burkholderiales bacterium]